MTALDQLKISVMNDKENSRKYNMERDRYQLMKYLKTFGKRKESLRKNLHKRWDIHSKEYPSWNIITVIQHWTHFLAIVIILELMCFK